MDQTRACSKSSRTALAWTKKKRSLRMRNLKANRASETEEQRKERLRIRRENDKIEKHEKQRLATLKRLKRGDDNEKPKTGEGGCWQIAQVGRGDRRRKKNKTGE